MTEMRFDNREIDKKIADQSKDLKAYIDESLEKTINPLLVQVTYTNGRMRKLERSVLIVSCVLGTFLLMKFPEVIKVIMLFL